MTMAMKMIMIIPLLIIPITKIDIRNKNDDKYINNEKYKNKNMTKDKKKMTKLCVYVSCTPIYTHLNEDAHKHKHTYTHTHTYRHICTHK